jgi:hypothetical protein
MRSLIIFGLLAGMTLLGWTGDPQEVSSPPAPAGDIRMRFESLHRAWKEKREFWVSSDLDVYLKCDEYERLVALGPRAVPFFVEEIDAYDKRQAERRAGKLDEYKPGDNADSLLQDAVERIAHRKFKDHLEMHAWWDSRGQFPVRFRQAYEQWQRARADGQSVLQVEETAFDDHTKRLQTRQTRTELGKAYFAIRDLGIGALPFLVETIKAGDYDLLSIYAEMVGWRDPPERAGTLADQARKALAYWELHYEELLLPPAPAPQREERKP